MSWIPVILGVLAVLAAAASLLTPPNMSWAALRARIARRRRTEET